MTPQSRAQRNLPRPGMPLEITSTENKRWLLKSQCDRHIHLGLAVWKEGLKSQLFTSVLLHVCLSEQRLLHTLPSKHKPNCLSLLLASSTNQPMYSADLHNRSMSNSIRKSLLRITHLGYTGPGRKGEGRNQLSHKQNYICLLPLEKLPSLTCENGRVVT